jgi:hypothetical protein
MAEELKINRRVGIGANARRVLEITRRNELRRQADLWPAPGLVDTSLS